MLKALISAEETLTAIVEKAKLPGVLQVKVRRFWGDAEIIIRMSGEEADVYTDSLKVDESLEQGEDSDADVQRAIRAIMLKAQGDKIEFSYSGGVNKARILVGMEKRSLILGTIIALALGIILGIIMKTVLPLAISEGIITYALNPVKTMFMNALKMVIAPVVFFSIVTCLAQFDSIKELGKIGAKVMGIYLLTSVIAVTLSATVSLIIKPGQFGFALNLTDIEQVTVDTQVDTSLLSTIINIVPDNFIGSFHDSDTLSIMFLAVICGIAAGMIGEYSSIVKNFFEAFNSLFLTITTIIAKFIPIAVFCNVTIIIYKIGGSTFSLLIGVICTYFLTIALMLFVYGLLILMIGHLNPITFYKKNREGMLTSLMLSSSSAAMPVNLKICTDKLGISPKVCNFSIPLGATVNMDGACIFMTIFGMFLARAYGINMDTSSLFTMALTIILISLGAPGVPGATIVIIGLIINCVGVPLEGIGLIMGIYPFLDMTNTMSNTTGDMAAALIVAKSENLLDVKAYKQC